MSQNIFQIDPIFFLPIDLEDNSKIPTETEEEAQNTILLNNNHAKKHKKNSHKKKITIEDDTTNEYSSSGKEMDQSFDLKKTEKPKKEEKI